MGSKLGKSLLNLASLFTGSAGDTFDTKLAPSEPFKPFAPKPLHRDTPTVPRRPARRKQSSDKSRHKSLTGMDQSIIGETIAEVETPLGSPTPRVKLTGEELPSVPMPGVPRIPSPTSTSESYSNQPIHTKIWLTGVRIRIYVWDKNICNDDIL